MVAALSLAMIADGVPRGTTTPADPVVNKRLEDIGVYGRKMSVAEFNGFVAKQVADWAPLVKASGAKLN